MKRTLRILGALMLVSAIIFVAFALQHPEMCFPWSGPVTSFLYAAYLAASLLLPAAPRKLRK